MEKSITQQQYNTVKTAEHHHDALHHAPHGTVVYWQRGKSGRGRWTKVHPSLHPSIVSGFTNESDVYLTVNQFRGWRQVRLLQSLRACYVDVDGTQDAPGVLDALHEQRLPEPNLLIRSGRGLHLYWLLEPVPAQALGFWSAIENHLVSALRPCGADPAARDAARVLRVAGTRHSGADEVVEGVVLHPGRWHIDSLAWEVLPYTRGEVREFRAAAAKKRGHKAKRTRRGQRTIFDWWYGVYSDLLTIADHHWWGGIPPGNRDNFLFLTSVALSWFTCGDALRNEIVSTARTWTPTLTKDEVLRQMQTVISRAEREAAARTRGEHVPRTQGRYWMRRKTIREWLGDAITPEVEPQLSALASDEVLAERKRNRDASRWKRSTKEQRERLQPWAQAMARDGYSQRAIAEHLGIGVATVHRWLRKEG